MFYLADKEILRKGIPEDFFYCQVLQATDSFQLSD